MQPNPALKRTASPPLSSALGVIKMMPCDYRSKSGGIKKFDLDAVFELVGGFSQVRKGWTALIIFVPSTGAFVELRSSPQDYRGNSEEEAEEIDEVYIQESFGLSQSQVQTFKANPQSWQFIDFRQARHGHA
ncbi:MAG: hypothetical protein IDH49_15180 [Gammaproteobacteria bacterium]|nr:hypothetical protein [Gammaproteobacteria bacterium]